MIKEFEGRTEQDAIAKAVKDLGLKADEFDVEIIESTQKGFFFKRGSVKIRVHVEDEVESSDSEILNDFESKVVSFLENIIVKMGFSGNVQISFREENKIGLEIVSEHSNILIGKKGKNLDALQLLVNVFAGRMLSDDQQFRIIVDAENYRLKREENIIRLARKTADQVKKSRGSKLLEPMNPFERRLIHTTLNEIRDISTISEGEGLYKKVRIFFQSESDY